MLKILIKYITKKKSRIVTCFSCLPSNIFSLIHFALLEITRYHCWNLIQNSVKALFSVVSFLFSKSFASQFESPSFCKTHRNIASPIKIILHKDAFRSTIN